MLTVQQNYDNGIRASNITLNSHGQRSLHLLKIIRSPEQYNAKSIE